jgi:hypothetical protein
MLQSKALCKNFKNEKIQKKSHNHNKKLSQLNEQ